MTPARILVVEDNRLTRELYREVLGERYDLVEAGDLASAREALREAPPDLVLLDLVLPDGQGAQLAGELRATPAFEFVPVLAVSGFLNDRAATALEGVDDYLVKPVDPDELELRVAELIGVHRPAESGRGAAALVVDDRSSSRRRCANLLRNAGYRVQAVQLGHVAIEVLATQEFDLVVADVLMPGLDGFQLTLAIRDDPRTTGVPVVLYSSQFGSPRDRDLARAVGAHALVCFPEEEATLLAQCREAMETAVQPPAVESVRALDERHFEGANQLLFARQVRSLEGDRRAALGRAQMQLVAGLAQATSAGGLESEQLDRLLARSLDSAGVSQGVLVSLAGGEPAFVSSTGVVGARAAIDQLWEGEAPLGWLPGPDQVYLPLGADEVDPSIRASLDLFDGAEALVFPLRFQGELQGILFLASRQGVLEARSGLEFAQALSVHLAQALALVRSVAIREEAEQRLRVLVDHLDVALWMVDVREQRCTYVSPGYRQIWGYPPESAVGELTKWGETIHPEDRDWVAQGYFERAEAGPWEIQYRILRADGEVAWILDRGFPVRNREGELHRLVGVAQDLTDQRRHQEELRRARELTGAVLAEGLHPTVVLDSELRPTLANRAFREAFGLPAALEGDSLDPQGANEVLAAIPDLLARLARVLEPGGPALRNHPARLELAPDRPLELRISGKAIHAGSSPSVLVTVEDLTSTRALEESFHRAQRMESLGRLAGGIAHDFNNILSIIAGCAELALDEVLEGEPLHDDLSKICEAARRGGSLTRQLLTLGRQRATHSEVVDLARALEPCRRMLERVIPESVVVRFDVPRDVGTVQVDADQLVQVLLNLAINARDAMPDGGELAVEARRLEPAEVARLSGLRDESYLEVTVRDTGAGMTPEVRAQIFEPFFTTKAEGKGSGLGLASVFGIVHQNDGVIEVESEPGKGSTFRLYFPSVEGEVAEEPAEPEVPVALEEGPDRRTVLLVEDDPDLRHLGVRILERTGLRVLSAGSPGDALLQLEREPHVPDLVVTDVVMPGMNGSQLIERIEERYGRLPVLFTSGYTADVALADVVRREDVEFLAKPFRPGDLLERVKLLLDAGT